MEYIPELGIQRPSQRNVLYMELIPLLVQAIQELSAKVDALEKQNKK